MPEWVSIAINLVLGVPLAALIAVFVRESARAAIAPLVGFRVFELQWGAGRQRTSHPVGPVDLAFAPFPIAGEGRWGLRPRALPAQPLYLLPRGIARQRRPPPSCSAVPLRSLFHSFAVGLQVA